MDLKAVTDVEDPLQRKLAAFSIEFQEMDGTIKALKIKEATVYFLPIFYVHAMRLKQPSGGGHGAAQNSG